MMQNKKLAAELHKLENVKNKKYTHIFKIIFGVLLVAIQLLSKFNESVKESVFCSVVLTFIVNMIEIFLWNIKTGITITNAFQKVLEESGRKTNAIWVDKCSEVCNRLMKSWLEKMVEKCIQHIIKKNPLLLKDLLEP